MAARMVCASSRAGTTMSISGHEGGICAHSCGSEDQNRPCAKNKYSQTIKARNAIIGKGYCNCGRSRVRDGNMARDEREIGYDGEVQTLRVAGVRFVRGAGGP